MKEEEKQPKNTVFIITNLLYFIIMIVFLTLRDSEVDILPHVSL